MSPGNAHPYSWSSIINGRFDGDEICRAGYPGVTEYLEANRDTLGIPGAEVVSVWSQDRAVSESIAGNSGITHIAHTLEEMIPLVDAVILARDDAGNHAAMAKPFLDAGVPLFIDKPLACTREDLRYFAGEHAKGRFIMSCSSMRYACENLDAKRDAGSLGKIELVTAVGKKDWLKYGVHMLEAVSAFLDDPRTVSVRHAGRRDKDIVVVEFEGGIQAVFHLFMDISSTFQFSAFGQREWRLVDMRNYYSMFRNNITEFIKSVEEGAPRLPFRTTENIIRTLIAAEESRLSGGVKINMSDF